MAGGPDPIHADPPDVAGALQRIVRGVEMDRETESAIWGRTGELWKTLGRALEQLEEVLASELPGLEMALKRPPDEKDEVCLVAGKSTMLWERVKGVGIRASQWNTLSQSDRERIALGDDPRRRDLLSGRFEGMIVEGRDVPTPGEKKGRVVVELFVYADGTIVGVFGGREEITRTWGWDKFPSAVATAVLWVAETALRGYVPIWVGERATEISVQTVRSGALGLQELFGSGRGRI